MQYPRARIVRVLIEYFGDDNQRIDHALRVLHHSERIMADHQPHDQDIVIACALLHDVGIKVSEEKLGYNNGRTQEEFGPPVAEELLRSINFPEGKIDIVKDIIGNHHSQPRHEYPELAILIEADRIVNRQQEA